MDSKQDNISDLLKSSGLSCDELLDQLLKYKKAQNLEPPTAAVPLSIDDHTSNEESKEMKEVPKDIESESTQIVSSTTTENINPDQDQNVVEMQVPATVSNDEEFKQKCDDICDENLTLESAISNSNSNSSSNSTTPTVLMNDIDNSNSQDSPKNPSICIIDTQTISPPAADHLDCEDNPFNFDQLNEIISKSKDDDLNLPNEQCEKSETPTIEIVHSPKEENQLEEAISINDTGTRNDPVDNPETNNSNNYAVLDKIETDTNTITNSNVKQNVTKTTMGTLEKPPDLIPISTSSSISNSGQCTKGNFKVEQDQLKVITLAFKETIQEICKIAKSGDIIVPSIMDEIGQSPVVNTKKSIPFLIPLNAIKPQEKSNNTTDFDRNQSLVNETNSSVSKSTAPQQKREIINRLDRLISTITAKKPDGKNAKNTTVPADDLIIQNGPVESDDPMMNIRIENVISTSDLIEDSHHPKTDNSPFISNSLENFLNNEDVALKISYPVPKCDAENGLKDHAYSTPYEKQFATQRRRGGVITNGTAVGGVGGGGVRKAKTLAEKRRWLQTEKTTKGRTRSSTASNVVVSHRNCYVMYNRRRYWVTSKLSKSTCLADITFRRSMWRKKYSTRVNAMSSYQMSSLSTTSSNYYNLYKSLLASDKFVPGVETERKPRLKYKPGPLSRKSSLQLRNNDRRTLVRQLPQAVVVMYPEFEKCTPYEAFALMQTSTGSVSLTSAQVEFALTALEANRTQPKQPFVFPLTYVNGAQSYILSEKVVGTVSKSGESTREMFDSVKCVVAKLIDYVEVKCIENDLIQSDDEERVIDSTPDLPPPPSTISGGGNMLKLLNHNNNNNNNNHSNSAIDDKKRSAFKRCFMEARRLNCKFVAVQQNDNDNSTSATKVTDCVECTKPHCILGCICDSLANSHNARLKAPLHCGRTKCMFQCTCDRSKVSTVNPLYVGHIESELKRDLAKVEREFTQTIIQTNGDNTIYVACQERAARRHSKVPKKFSDYVNEEGVGVMTYNDTLVNTAVHLPTVKVVVERLDLDQIIPLCLIHREYNCTCIDGIATTTTNNNNSSGDGYCFAHAVFNCECENDSSTHQNDNVKMEKSTTPSDKLVCQVLTGTKRKLDSSSSSSSGDKNDSTKRSVTANNKLSFECELQSIAVTGNATKRTTNPLQKFTYLNSTKKSLDHTNRNDMSICSWIKFMDHYLHGTICVWCRNGPNKVIDSDSMILVDAKNRPKPIDFVRINNGIGGTANEVVNWIVHNSLPQNKPRSWYHVVLKSLGNDYYQLYGICLKEDRNVATKFVILRPQTTQNPHQNFGMIKLTGHKYTPRLVLQTAINKQIPVLLPKPNGNPKWKMVPLESPDYCLRFCDDVRLVRFEDLRQINKAAQTIRNTITLTHEAIRTETPTIVDDGGGGHNPNLFGIYCTPPYPDCVFIGPFFGSNHDNDVQTIYFGKNRLRLHRDDIWLKELDDHTVRTTHAPPPVIDLTVCNSSADVNVTNVSTATTTSTVTVTTTTTTPSSTPVEDEVIEYETYANAYKVEESASFLEACRKVEIIRNSSLLSEPFVTESEFRHRPNKFVLTNIKDLGYFDIYHVDSLAPVDLYWPDRKKIFHFINESSLLMILKHFLHCIFYIVDVNFDIETYVATCVTVTDKPVTLEFLCGNYICGHFGHYSITEIPKQIQKSKNLTPRSIGILVKTNHRQNIARMVDYFGNFIFKYVNFEQHKDRMSTILSWALCSIHHLRRREEAMTKKKEEQMKRRDANIMRQGHLCRKHHVDLPITNDYVNYHRRFTTAATNHLTQKSTATQSPHHEDIIINIVDSSADEADDHEDINVTS